MSPSVIYLVFPEMYIYKLVISVVVSSFTNHFLVYLKTSDVVQNWMSKEDDLETEPTFVVKDTPSVASDAKPTFVSKETEGERGSLSIDESESSSLSGLDKNEAKQMGK